MEKCEKLAREYLLHLGFSSIVYEPLGVKTAPDFLVHDRVAVEVRRLNQNEITKSGFRGLEEIRIPTERKFRKLLSQLGPARSNTSWFVTYTLRRPVARWGRIEAKLRERLEIFRDNRGEQKTCCTPIAQGFDIHFLMKASQCHPTFYVYGGGADSDTGGFVLGEVERNLRLCIAEKTRKTAPIRHKYPEWWLIFLDQVGYGFDLDDQALFREHLKIDHNWDKVILLNPLNTKSAFEVPKC